MMFFRLIVVRRGSGIGFAFRKKNGLCVVGSELALDPGGGVWPSCKEYRLLVRL